MFLNLEFKRDRDNSQTNRLFSFLFFCKMAKGFAEKIRKKGLAFEETKNESGFFWPQQKKEPNKKKNEKSILLVRESFLMFDCLFYDSFFFFSLGKERNKWMVNFGEESIGRELRLDKLNLVFVGFKDMFVHFHIPINISSKFEIFRYLIEIFVEE